MLISDTGVPQRYVEYDDQGVMSMARLEDGWCAALDRSTHRCSIYDKRPQICREFAMGGYECLAERTGAHVVTFTDSFLGSGPDRR